MRTLEIAIVACLVALSIATNYALIGVWNVKLMDFIVFVGGFCFGPVVGVLIGVFSWAVYGTLNPQGFMLQIWLATMFSEMIYGIIGGFLRKGLGSNFKGERWRASVFFASIGALLTLVYDVITNVVFGLTAGWNIIFAVVVGFIPFGLLHEVSNICFFGFGSVPVISAINKVVGGERNVNLKE
jgi:uncharacterized membrane protein YeaQ/YmgE (transglycosylase-associated protein family)